MSKKLYRSVSNKKIAGVCGGIAAYFNVDATLIRLIFVLVSIFSAAFPGLLIYCIFAVIMPEEPISGQPYDVNYQQVDHQQGDN